MGMSAQLWWAVGTAQAPVRVIWVRAPPYIKVQDRRGRDTVTTVGLTHSETKPPLLGASGHGHQQRWSPQSLPQNNGYYQGSV